MRDLRQKSSLLPRPLLIVGPSLLFCHVTAKLWGLDPEVMTNTRSIHKVELLRGWSLGTAFIASDMEKWATIHGRAGAQMHDVLMAGVSSGRFRLAQDRDLAGCRPDVPLVPAQPAQEVRP